MPIFLMRRVLTVVLCVSAVAAAEGPVVMPYPLAFKRVPAGVGAEEKEAIRREYSRMLRQAGASTPDFARGEEAVKALTWGDCEREDACLSQLATLSGALYGIFTSVDQTLEGALVVSGRVIRDDGKVAAPTQVVRLQRGNEAFREAVKRAFVELFGLLRVSELPAVRQVESAQAAERATPEVTLPPVPPAPMLVETGSPRRTAGQVALGVGAGGVVLGAALLGAGQAIGGTLKPVGGALPAQQVGDYRAASGLTTAGIVGLSLGAAAALAGAILWVTAPSSVTVSIGPTQGGAVLGFQGEF